MPKDWSKIDYDEMIGSDEDEYDTLNVQSVRQNARQTGVVLGCLTRGVLGCWTRVGCWDLDVRMLVRMPSQWKLGASRLGASG